MIQIYTGDGKGKTTAAAGAALRAAGGGRKVLFFQFLKDNSSGERAALSCVPGITLKEGIENIGKVWSFGEEEIKKLVPYYNRKIEEIREEMPDYDMAVLDEFITALNYGYADKELCYAFVRDFPKDKELVITGRGADERLLEAADYVSEIKKVKHPFDRGITAREGIEY